MYYSAGTYESFAHPEKPKDVDKKSAYIIGTGLAGLTAAFYLVRDGQMKGERIHLLEKLELAGGSCDGRKDVTKGFFMRGGREMDNHFEVMWDTFRDVPSIETPGVSVLDEYYWLNKHDPNYSLCRATVNRGEDAHTDKQFKLDKASALALSKLFMTPEKDLEDKKISDVLPDSFWSTNFWLYWQTMFAFQRWSSALEMKRYLCRYVHHIDGLPDFSALRFTKYNQYESMILPLVKYLESHGVGIEYGMDVKNVIIDDEGDKKVAKRIVYVKDGSEQTIELTENDLVFITNGCCTDTSCYGDQTHAPDLSGIENGKGESWDMWKAIAAQAKHGEYGELRPAGIMYSHIRFVKAEMTPYELEKAEAEGKFAEKTSLARAREYKPDGLMLGDEIMPALNTDNEGIFTIYRLTAKGAVHGASTAKPVSEERLKAMERFALNKVNEMAEKIHGGEIKADPLETGGVLPCTYCDYKAMCPEPDPKNPRAVSPADKEKLESALEEIEKEIGKEEN